MKYVLIIFVMAGASGATSEQVPMKNAQLCEIAAEAVAESKNWKNRLGAFKYSICLKVK